MGATQKIRASGECERSSANAVSSQAAGSIIQKASSEVRLEDLIPIAVVIAAGCEPCAVRMVERALQQGSSERQIQKVLSIVAYLQKQDCLTGAVGSETLARMGKPLARARRTLEEASQLDGTKLSINGGAR